MLAVLGAGVSGLSVAKHSRYQDVQVFERNNYIGGHAASHASGGFIWDEGPHVSFTKSEYVRELFASAVNGRFRDLEARVGNYFDGHWIPHPVQVHLYALPEAVRDSCLRGFLSVAMTSDRSPAPRNYREWLEQSLGAPMTDLFSAPYTRKYWGCEPELLGTDWIGSRVLRPNVEQVRLGAQGPPSESGHYITSFRYPDHGGFAAFLQGMLPKSPIAFNHDVSSIDLTNKVLYFSNGSKQAYSRLVSTLPLPTVVGLCQGVPNHVREAAGALRCTALLLVNVEVRGSVPLPYHWFYVYDEALRSTRVTQTHLLSPSSVPYGMSGLQVEVYSQSPKDLTSDSEAIASQVVSELRLMNLADEIGNVQTQFVRFANVVFDSDRRAALDTILCWLEQFGLEREADDLDPMTNWERPREGSAGQLVLAGRFAQWKYFWTDDCVLRGREIADRTF